MSQRNCVKPAPVLAAIIIATSAYWGKSGSTIHGNRRIPVPDFQMHASYSIVSCAFQEVIEKAAPDPSAVMAGNDGDQQQFGFVRNDAREGKAERLIAVRLSS